MGHYEYFSAKTVHHRWMSPEYKPGLASVIVPTFNRAHLILDSLTSVYGQSYRPIELLIIDDGSTDQTATVVEEWARKHRHDDFQVKYFNQKNSGAPAARNLGLIESRGEFLQILDSDDILHADKLREQIHVLQKNRDDFVWAVCDSFIDQPDYQALPPPPKEPRVRSIADHIKRGGCLCTMTGIYRRSLCEKVGPWKENLQIWQDREYNLRTLLQSNKITYLPQLFSLHRLNHGSRISDKYYTAHLIESLHNLELTLGECSQLTCENSEALAAVYFAHSLAMLERGEREIARSSIQDGIRLCTTRSCRFKLQLLSAISALPRNLSITSVKLLRKIAVLNRSN